MKTIKLKDFILTTEIRDNVGDLKTKDKIFIESSFRDCCGNEPGNICGIDPKDLIATPSHYAIVHGAMMDPYFGGDGDREPKYYSPYYIRSCVPPDQVSVVDSDGTIREFIPNSFDIGIRPIMRLDLDKIVKVRKITEHLFRTPAIYSGKKLLYHQIEFGEYPQNLAPDSDKLTEELASGGMLQTGKSYIEYGNTVVDGEHKHKKKVNQEYKYDGRRYVKIDNPRHYAGVSRDTIESMTGSRYEFSYDTVWAEVQPIKWIILNWDDMPKEINPEGSGKADCMLVKSRNVLMSNIPYSLEDSNDRTKLWQNSVLRAYLNGYNIQNELAIGNGDSSQATHENYDFSSFGFIDVAFDDGVVMNNDVFDDIFSHVKRSRLDRLNPDTTPESARRKMTDTEVIESWIESGQSVLLRGPSGIGKTERILKLYPDCIHIKLTNNMFPERVVGSMNLQTGDSIPPEYAKQAILACATDEERKQVQESLQMLYELSDEIFARSKTSDKKIVILLDELLNVKPAVQSLVYTLVLNKFIESGSGLKLPKNTVVVATGNQKKYSSVAEDIVEPLEKRFDHILDMDPKVGEWLYEYAIPNKIHPEVIGYILCKYNENRKSENIKDIGYFYEEPEVGEKHLDKNGCRGKTNDPRGWTSISNMLYAFEEDLKNGKYTGKDVNELLKTSLGTKLREEWASEFYDFYNNPTINVEDVVSGNYTDEDAPKDTNNKYATMSGLLTAEENEVEACRDYIRKYCGAEYVAVYDMYWAGTDNARIKKIKELRDKSKDSMVDMSKVPDFAKKEYKITLKEFWERDRDKAIICDTEEKAKALCEAFDKMGKTWSDNSCYTDGNLWGHYGSEGICYTNKNSCCGLDFARENYECVYDFDDVDIDVDKKHGDYKITLDEFWGSEKKDLAIHCDTLEKAIKLCDAFDKVGHTWLGGDRYVEDARWGLYKGESCYSNNGLYGDIDFYKEKGYKIYEFDNVDINVKDKDKITLDEFWGSEKKDLAIHCDTLEKAIKLCVAFDKAGHTWSSGGERYTDENNWNRYKTRTCYSNNGTYASVDFYEGIYKIYEFDDVDISSKDKDESDSKYATTLDEFFEMDTEAAIHCDTLLKSKLLSKAMDNMGKTWESGDSYIRRNIWGHFKENTCYTNRGQYIHLEGKYDKITIFPFSSVDIHKYLSKKESYDILTEAINELEREKE